MSATGKALGNLLDSLPGTGPRTLLGALALVVGITFWLQPKSQADELHGFEEARTAEVVVEEEPATLAPAISDELESTAVEPDGEVEVRADSVLP